MENIIRVELHLNFAGKLLVQKFEDSNYATAVLKGSPTNYYFRTTANNKEDLRSDALLFVKKEIEKTKRNKK